MCYGGGWEGGGLLLAQKPCIAKVTQNYNRRLPFLSLKLRIKLFYTPSTALPFNLPFQPPTFSLQITNKIDKRFRYKIKFMWNFPRLECSFLCRIKKIAYFLRSYVFKNCQRTQKMWNASRFCVSSLRRGHANLLCIVPILVYVLPKQVHYLA